MTHVCMVLRRLLENWLFMKALKCQFCIRLVPFLVFIFESGQVRGDPGKISVVTNWLVPTDRKQLQVLPGVGSFL